MRRLVIALLVLVGLFVAVDYGAAALAESAVSRQMREQIGLVDDPSVRINGFPFLYQALTGDYRNVEVSADRVTVARLNDVSVEATLHHVRVPFSQLVSGSADTVRIDEVVGRVRIQAAELEKLINVEDLQVEKVTDRDTNAAGQPVPDNAVKLTGTAEVLGQRNRVTVIGSLGRAGGQVQIQAHTVEVNGQTLAPIIEQTVLRLFTVRLDPGQLPFAVTPTSVKADDGSLVVEGNARNIVVNSSGVTG